MAAITSIIYIGHGHSNDGGIRPIATIQLEEGSRPNFSVIPGDRKIYTPTTDNMLDDLIFMIAVEVAKNPIAIQLFDKHFISNNKTRLATPRRTQRVEMFENFNHESRLIIYSSIKTRADLPKVVICLFKGSGLYDSAKNIKDYNIEFEICESTMGKQYSHWSKGWERW